MTVTSGVLGLLGLLTLFIPETILTTFGAPTATPLPLLVQLLGGGYFAFALMDWTAKDGAIGGIYARPISLGNFTHFFIGGLLLLKYQLSNPLSIPILVLLLVYGVFGGVFWWLVFKHTGLSAS